jgi:glycosyltransferase involved in cell wall biosynthesis
MATIILCSNAYPPRFIGGAELIAHQHAVTLAKAGYRVLVFAGSGHASGKRYSVQEDSLDGIPIFRIQLTADDYAADRVNFQNNLVDDAFSRLLERYSPTVVHMHNIIGLSLGIIGRAKQFDSTVVTTLHDHWGYCFKNTIIKRDSEICKDFTRCTECMATIPDGTDRQLPIRMRTDYLAYRLNQVDSFISPSRFLARSYLKAGIPLTKMRIIWNGVDVRRFANVVKSPSSGRVRFTFIGHFGAHKGIRTLFEALPQVGDPRLYRINLVGEGHLRESLEAWASRQPFSSSIRFWGKVDNQEIESVFRETDVLILPSIWPENQPVSITEAMATKTPVIASDMGGISELIEDGAHGYLFPAGDATALADRMRRFLDDSSAINRLGACGFDRIHSCTFGNQVSKIIQVYREAGAEI